MGELKKGIKMDTSQGTWLDLSQYARVILKEQDLRQFVLGFTLCGPHIYMRLWYFDRAGGIASPSFNINEDGQFADIAVIREVAMEDAFRAAEWKIGFAYQY